MQRFTAIVALLLLAGACSDSTSESRIPTRSSPVLGPGPTPAPPPPPVQPREIALGEVVQDRITDALTRHDYQLTAPATGTLVARLSWDVGSLGTLLKLVLDSAEFRPIPPEWSPVTGRLPVVAGHRYRLTVSLAGADWIPDDRFTLITTLE